MLFFTLNLGKDNIKFTSSEVRFTKVLTKYSTEYNNMLFIQNLCRQLNMDKKDMLNFFSTSSSKSFSRRNTRVIQ